MADAGARWHHLEIVERLAAPFEELVALAVALIFELDVLAEGLGVPNSSTITLWSMTRWTGTSGLIFCGSPPSALMASRMAARSTTAGTPVKSCISTRAGRYWISRAIRRSFCQSTIAWRSSRVTVLPSSKRSRFSSSTFIEKGRREMSPSTSAALAQRIISVGLAPDFERRAGVEAVLAGRGSSLSFWGMRSGWGGGALSNAALPGGNAAQVEEKLRRTAPRTPMVTRAAESIEEREEGTRA